MAWEYEPDENPKRKHHWNHDESGFVRWHGTPVGKCPSSVTLEDATTWLNAGIEWPLELDETEHPQRIYYVSDGTVYRACPTVPGRSYHGYPELREKLPPDRELHRKLMDLAKQDGSELEVKRWLRSKRTEC